MSVQSILPIRDIYLDTQSAFQKLNGTYNSQVVFNFNQALLPVNDPRMHIDVCILNVQVPISYYLINDYNNTINYMYQGFDTTATISNGNYDGFNLATALTIATANHIVFTFDSINLIMTFTSSNLFGIYASSTIGQFMGVTVDRLGVLSGSSYVATSNALVNYIYTKNLYFNSNLLVGSLASNTSGYCTTLIRLPISSDFGTIMFWENKGESYLGLLTNQIQLIEISVLDDDGNFVNFQNFDWSISLRFRCYLKPEYNPYVSPINNIDYQSLVEQQYHQGLQQQGQSQQQEEPQQPSALDEYLTYGENIDEPEQQDSQEQL